LLLKCPTGFPSPGEVTEGGRPPFPTTIAYPTTLFSSNAREPF
jgi:hypothetical protein